MNRFFKKETVLILLIVLIGGFLRFYKLDWLQGLFSHPDEYHIAASVNQLSFPTQMHPHFFSYGTVIIYLIYFTKELLNSLSSILNSESAMQNLIPNSFLIGRFYSALFSTLTIFLIYHISRSFLNRSFSFLAAFLVALTPGAIQQAHFATPESAQTFFLFLSLLFMIKFIKRDIILNLAIFSIALGFALGVKINSIVFLIPLITTIVINSLNNPQKLIKLLFLSLTMVFITLHIVAPYIFLDFPAFKSNLDYEGGLAIGKIPVFYTRQFINTIPIMFQLEKILPYALGPIILLFAFIGFIFLILDLLKKPKIPLILVAAAFLSLFISNAFLFAKWTRFIAPTFPFFSIFAVLFLKKFIRKKNVPYYFLSTVLLLSTILWTLAFSSIYINRDIRITASEWIQSNIPQGSFFLIEGGNTVDLPLYGNFPKTSIDFYSLEENPITRARIAESLYSIDYFIVQSRRVFYNHQRLRNLYPRTARFYDALFNGKLGFEEIREFHSFPKLEVIGYKLEVADETAEETWSVFDHPVIRIFRKTNKLSREDYAKFLEI